MVNGLRRFTLLPLAPADNDCLTWCNCLKTWLPEVTMFRQIKNRWIEASDEELDHPFSPRFAKRLDLPSFRLPTKKHPLEHAQHRPDTL